MDNYAPSTNYPACRQQLKITMSVRLDIYPQELVFARADVKRWSAQMTAPFGGGALSTLEIGAVTQKRQKGSYAGPRPKIKTMGGISVLLREARNSPAGFVNPRTRGNAPPHTPAPPTTNGASSRA
jgi:hypothetical protein